MILIFICLETLNKHLQIYRKCFFQSDPFICYCFHGFSLKKSKLSNLDQGGCSNHISEFILFPWCYNGNYRPIWSKRESTNNISVFILFPWCYNGNYRPIWSKIESTNNISAFVNVSMVLTKGRQARLL